MIGGLIHNIKSLSIPFLYINKIMRIAKLLEMPQIVDFNYNVENTKIKKILKNFKIEDFEHLDANLNLYKSADGHWSEIWFIIFNKKKTDIDFIVKFKQDALVIQKGFTR